MLHISMYQAQIPSGLDILRTRNVILGGEQLRPDLPYQLLKSPTRH